MPPFLPRKRLRSPSPVDPSHSKSDIRGGSKDKGKGKSASLTPRKPALFDDLDAGTRPTRVKDHGKALLQQLAATDDDDSSLSSLSDEDFEDVPVAKRQKANQASDDDEDMEFEDVDTNGAPGPSAPLPSGDLELTLTKDTRVSLVDMMGKKMGPSKRDRQIRISTHQVHVQFLMWHNAIRNSWLCDKEIQQILVEQLPLGAKNQVEKWKQKSGIATSLPPKGKGKKSKGKSANVRSQRDWSEPAERLDESQVDMSHGDPLFNLLKYLKHYWKQRFRVTAPGLRKMGYRSLQRLDEEIKDFNKDCQNAERHGERIKDLNEFKECAKAMEGSRDVGAQLFTALLRGLGLEARMVASLQPVGFGWNKNEDAIEKKRKNNADAGDDERSNVDGTLSDEEPAAPKAKGKEKQKVDLDDDESDEDVAPKVKGRRRPAKANGTLKSAKKPTRRTFRGNAKNSPIILSESELSAPEDDESVVDITPARPRTLPSKPYDKDLLFPHYWTEVLSPVTNTYTAVDAVVLNITATNAELLQKFETRGQKSEKAKQVTAYIIGHSSDCTAKDVTVRYLKNHMLPGRTKGNRYPVEKIPVNNRHGKVKYYEQYDWFKTVMGGYVRGTQKYPQTEIDEHEDATDLKAAQPQKKEVKEGEETLQYYKTSAEFVLERHLKREEALLPQAKHVKMFSVKGKNGTSTEEKVFRRKDVVSCKSTETWHKEGREPKPGEEPRKRVPYRAATTNRKRELAEAEHISGQKILQGLFSRDQTDWIIPPPIENGVIPKNNFGNMDCFVPSMVPEGAVHIPKRGTMKICKRLGIDYAEAVTGFEFGARMAVPIITGVVVAVENYQDVMEHWEKDEAERVRKEDEKRTKAAIGMWRKMLMGMRVIERLKEDYRNDAGDDVDIPNPFTNRRNRRQSEKDIEKQARDMEKRDMEMAGGFLPEGHDEEEPETHPSFFPVAQEDEEEEEGGGFIVSGLEEQPKPTIGQAYATPQPLESNPKNETAQLSDADEEIVDATPAPAPKRRGRPAGSANKANSSKSTLAKRYTAKPKAQAKRAGRRKSQAAEEGKDQEDEAESSSSVLSDLVSDSEESSFEVEQKKQPAKKRRVTMPVARSNVSPRKTPRRNATRKSETALRSHYFEQDEGDEE